MPEGTNDVYNGATRNGRKRFSNPTSVKGFVTGHHSVTTSGTTLGDQELSSGVRIKADIDTDAIFVGGSDVSTDNGYRLADNEEVFIDVDCYHMAYTTKNV